MDAATVVSLVCEVISTIAVPAGAGLLLVWGFTAVRARGWEPVDAIIMRTPDGLVACWFDDEGRMHEAPLSRGVRADSGDDIRVWVRAGSDVRARLNDPAHHAATWRLLGLALLVPGVLAAIVGSAVTAAS